MAICQVCAKSKQYGHNISHSHRVTKRVFLPNVVRKRIYVNGTIAKAMVCGKCIKRVKKYGKMTAKDDAKLAGKIITFVDWKQLAEEKHKTKTAKSQISAKSQLKKKSGEKAESVDIKPETPKTKEISVEELVGRGPSDPSM